MVLRACHVDRIVSCVVVCIAMILELNRTMCVQRRLQDHERAQRCDLPVIAQTIGGGVQSIQQSHVGFYSRNVLTYLSTSVRISGSSRYVSPNLSEKEMMNLKGKAFAMVELIITLSCINSLVLLRISSKVIPLTLP